MFRYFLEQLGSLQSRSTGEAEVEGSIDGLDDLASLELDRLRLLALPAASSSMFFIPQLPVSMLLLTFRFPPDRVISLAGLDGVTSPLRRPLAPLRNLLFNGLKENSPIPPIPLIVIGVLEAVRPLLGRLLCPLDSESLVGESQNLFD